MAADPTLADLLDAFGDKPTDADAVLHLGRVQPEPFRSQMMAVAHDLDEGQRLARAAAVRLRKLDAIDPDELRAIGDRLRELDPYWREAEERKQLLYALADAMGGTE